MSVSTSEEGTIVLQGNCSVEDAEPLLRLLLSESARSVEWTHCDQLHTAVLQVLLAVKPKIAGPCGDLWVEQWIVNNPLQNQAISSHVK